MRAPIRRSTIATLLSIGLLTAPAASEELKGKVTAVNETSVEVGTDSDLLPRVDDKVEIFIELKAIKSTALVTTGRVTNVNGVSIVIQIDDPKASVIVGQLARINSAQPMKKGHAETLPQADATTPAPSVPKPPAQSNRYMNQAGAVWSMAFAPNGHQAISIDSEGSVLIWEVQTGQVVRRFQTSRESGGVAYSADGTRIAWGNNNHALVYDLPNDRQLADIEAVQEQNKVTNVAFSPDGRNLLTASNFGGPARLWDIATQQEIRRFDPLDVNGNLLGVCHAAFSPDGRLVLCGSSWWFSLWDAHSGNQIPKFQSQEVNAECAVFSADGRYILAGAHPAEPVRMWDVQGGREVARFVGHRDGVRAVAFVPGNRRILTGSKAEPGPGSTLSSDYSVRLWDVNTMKEIGRFDKHKGPILCMAVSPDGNIALTSDATIKLWQLPK